VSFYSPFASGHLTPHRKARGFATLRKQRRDLQRSAPTDDAHCGGGGFADHFGEVKVYQKVLMQTHSPLVVMVCAARYEKAWKEEEEEKETSFCGSLALRFFFC